MQSNPKCGTTQPLVLGKRVQASQHKDLDVKKLPPCPILTQNLYYNYYYPKPKYLIIGYMDPLGTGLGSEHRKVQNACRV